MRNLNKVKLWLTERRLSYDNKFSLFIFCLTVTKSMLGSFIFFQPLIIFNTGIFIAIFLQILSMAFSFYTFVVIGYYAALDQEIHWYSDLYLRFGVPFSVCTDIINVLVRTISNSYYLSFASKLIYVRTQKKIEFYGIVLMMGFLILLPLSLFKNLRSLRFLTIVNFALLIAILISTLVDLFKGERQKIPLAPSNWYNVFIAIPVYSGSFDCHVLILDFYKDFKKNAFRNSLERYSKISFLAFLIYFSLCFLYGIFFAFAYGNHDYDFVPSKFSALLIVFSLILSYSYFVGSILKSLDAILGKINKSAYEKSQPFVFRSIKLFFIVSITIVIAIFIKNLNLLVLFVWFFNFKFVFDKFGFQRQIDHFKLKI
ncbi:hypothetical protein MHBO_002670 [Bonamia ostreae]|uniref:Amino acid transporter transmembrane domain-containing protein n=1 Tax=Bonamia ostreae TaxID=126728 RepID=A0ABV2AN60_9EUKA